MIRRYRGWWAGRRRTRRGFRMQNFAGFCCGPAAGPAAAAFDDDENLCEMKNFYPNLRRFPCQVLLHLLSNGHDSALNPVVLPSVFVSSTVAALAASLSWRCFMEWKTRCASAVASLLFAIFFASLYVYTGQWMRRSLARDSEGEQVFCYRTLSIGFASNP